MASYSGKGWFAILLGKVIDFDTTIPDYIIDAIFFAHGKLSDDVLFKILKYRLIANINDLDEKQASADAAEGHTNQWHTQWNEYIAYRRTFADTFRSQLEQFRDGNLTAHQIIAAMVTNFPDDKINLILARL